MKRFFFFLILSSCALCSQHKYAGASERYQLHWRQTVQFQNAGYKYIHPEWEVWLRDELASKTLWKRTLKDDFDPKKDVLWSKNRKAVALSRTTDYFVWREGYRLRHFGAPSDYTMGFAWSPDNRRLLVRSDGSGASDGDEGGLYCLELGTWPRYKYFHLGAAHEFKWIGSNKVRVTQLDYDAINKHNKYGYTKPPFFWRVPRNSSFRTANRYYAKRRR